jgi:hypothetical protein
MPRYETRTSQFGLVSGIQQPRSDMVLVAEPTALFSPEVRKGQLYLIVEADQDLARGRDACQLVARTIRKQFYDDRSYSVTSALRKAISAANQALYQHNFDAIPQKRATVGVTCAVIKDNDLYLAQVLPAQAYVLAEGKLRALPTNLSWNPAQGSAAPFLRMGALGSSLSVEPEFYRAVLRPGDALVLCSSNLARLLGRDEVMRLLRSPEPSDITAGLLALCKQNALPEAHGLAVAICAPLSPAAQAAPLSRAGISERGRVALRTMGGWAARVTGEAALLIKGPGGRDRARKAAARREQERREQAQLSRPHIEPAHSPTPPPPPRPLDLGSSLEDQVAQARAARPARMGQPAPRPIAREEVPPSTFLGEGLPMPPAMAERRVDLSDTPGMAALGRHARVGQPPPANATLRERLAWSLARTAGALALIGHRRRLRRPPPSAMPPRRPQQGLSYRRQRPPFPFLLLLLLVSLVALLVLYGVNLSRENALRQTEDALTRAEQMVAAIREAPDQTSAQERLDAAAAALSDVQASGLVTATQENRLRYEDLQREYERALAAVRKLTYFDDLTTIAAHPVPGGQFASVVVPPPPQGITNTEAFNAIYALDTNAGVLYRMPRTGGAFQPFLRPDDVIGDLKVGMVKAQEWRVDNIVAIAQSIENGPFTFYFRSGDSWSRSILAGSEEWGNVGEHFRAVNYEGNLYIWGASRAAPGQVLKYFSGRYGEFPVPWIQNDGGHKTDSAIDLAIDGNVYLLQPDGRVLVFSAGAFQREISPPEVTPPLVTPAGFFVTGPPESGAIFLVDTNNERILQIDKQSGALIQQIRARPAGPIRLDQLTNVFVDASGGRAQLYLVNGGQIVRGALPEPPRPFRDTSAPSATSTPPAPTALP